MRDQLFHFGKDIGSALYIAVIGLVVAALITTTRKAVAKGWRWSVGLFRKTETTAQIHPIAPLRRDTVAVWLLMAAIVVLAIWNRQLESTVLRLHNESGRDILRLHNEMVRFVLPRSLSPEQQAAISDFLSHTEPREILISVVPEDSEAGIYSSDIVKAIEKGGWAVTPTSAIQNISEGVQMELINSPSTSPVELTPLQRLHHKPPPSDLLRDALERGGVLLSGSSNNGGTSSEATKLVLLIGHRPRGKWAVRPKQSTGDPFREPTDDDVY